MDVKTKKQVNKHIENLELGKARAILQPLAAEDDEAKGWLDKLIEMQAEYKRRKLAKKNNSNSCVNFFIAITAVFVLFVGMCCFMGFILDYSSTEGSNGYRYIAGASSSVNIRSEPSADSRRVTSLLFGTQIKVIESKTVNGELWYQVEHEGNKGWVLSSLTTKNVPVANTQRDESAPIAAPTQRSTAIPPTSVPPRAPQFTCDCSKTCGWMSSCQEAYFQLNQCGCSRRDGDGDGVPCESIC